MAPARKKKKATIKKVRKQPTTDGGPVVLGENIGIRDVGSLVGVLEAALVSKSALIIDADAVKAVDIAALQVLAGFANSASAQSRAIEWRCDKALREFAELADLDRHLQFDVGQETNEDDGLCPVF